METEWETSGRKAFSGEDREQRSEGDAKQGR